MNAYHAVLYVHLLSLLLAFVATAIIWLCVFGLRAAATLEEAAPWGMLAGKTERVFPVAILGLFATGAYMTSDVWSWSIGWIACSVVALAVLALQGPLVAGRRAHALKHALMANGPGLLGEEARRLTRDPALWAISFANPAIALGVVWSMTLKPGWAGSVAAVVVAYAVGAAAGLRLARGGAVEAAPASEPAG